MSNCRFLSLWILSFEVFLFSPIALQAEIVIAPYVQPGPNAGLDASDSVVISWVANNSKGAFLVEYGESLESPRTAVIEEVALKLGKKGEYYLYRALLEGLPPDRKVQYRVKEGPSLIREASFPTRATPSKPIKFVVLGDIGQDAPAPKKVAYQIWKAEPQFGVVVGDIVYPSGLFEDYLRRFVGFYINTTEAGPEQGAPLLGSIPFYFVIGNHDIHGADLGASPDGCAAFYLWRSPLNGPAGIPLMPTVRGPAESLESFRTAAGKGYPGLANYSFDNGAAHFLVLDANAHVNVADPIWKGWIEKDLSESRAQWKFVFFHQPGFHSSKHHYDEQRMRALAPIFEKTGVDIVFSGHVHNYQRSKPLRFEPSEDVNKIAVVLRTGIKTRIDGKFILDEEFDGVSHTKPKGVIYILSGAGGAATYDSEQTGRPELWSHEAGNWAPFTVSFHGNLNSFTEVALANGALTLRQIDLEGRELDKFEIQKGSEGNASNPAISKEVLP